MPVTTADKRATFRKMHESGCFVHPQSLGCRQRAGAAAASASRQWPRPARALPGRSASPTIASRWKTCCEHLTELCGAVDLPVNADFEGGFAHRAGEGRAPMSRARSRPALPGCRSRIPPAMPPSPLYERALAIARIKAARAAIDADKSGVLLTGRCEGFLVGQADLEHGDRSAEGLFGGRRRLPLCAGHQDQGADLGGREGRASEAGQSLDRRRPGFRSRKPPSSAFAASASAARWRAPRGPASCARRARSRRREHSPSSAAAIPAPN